MHSQKELLQILLIQFIIKGIRNFLDCKWIIDHNLLFECNLELNLEKVVYCIPFGFANTQKVDFNLTPSIGPLKFKSLSNMKEAVGLDRNLNLLANRQAVSISNTKFEFRNKGSDSNWEWLVTIPKDRQSSSESHQSYRNLGTIHNHSSQGHLNLSLYFV